MLQGLQNCAGLRAITGQRNPPNKSEPFLPIQADNGFVLSRADLGGLLRIARTDSGRPARLRERFAKKLIASTPERVTPECFAVLAATLERELAPSTDPEGFPPEPTDVADLPLTTVRT